MNGISNLGSKDTLEIEHVILYKSRSDLLNLAKLTSRPSCLQ